LVFQPAFQNKVLVRMEDVSIIRKMEEVGKEVAENYSERARSHMDTA
jgi:hypothetical protein